MFGRIGQGMDARVSVCLGCASEAHDHPRPMGLPLQSL